MTNGRNTDTTAARAARRAAAARRRAERAARELIMTPSSAWSLQEFSDITTAGAQALEVVKRREADRT